MRKPIISFYIVVILVLCVPVFLSGQEIFTAENYFDEVSARYGKIRDYTATISITQGETIMGGTLYYKNPNLLRIDFSEPSEQVLVTNGKELTIYIPKYEVILVQKLRRRSQAAIASMASEQGLHLLKKNYGVAYLSGPEFIPLDETSEERVRKLKLESRSTAEGFRQIELAGVLKGAVWFDSVPPFPDRCCPLLYGIEPGRIAFLVQKVIGDIQMTVPAQYMA